MPKTKINLIAVFALLLTSNLLHLTPIASAVGLEVNPSKIKLEGTTGEKFQTYLTVSNPSPEVAVFDVYPDSFDLQIKTSPASFVLESGQSREVSVSFNFSESGQFQTNLSVVARPLSKNSFNAGGGVKIPVELTIQNRNPLFLANIMGWFGQNQNPLVGIAAFLIILVFVIFGIKSFLKKKSLSS
ncbi:MAG: hypothetical protein AAB738_02550 [Patescibacteria group bacterium]